MNEAPKRYKVSATDSGFCADLPLGTFPTPEEAIRACEVHQEHIIHDALEEVTATLDDLGTGDPIAAIAFTLEAHERELEEAYDRGRVQRTAQFLKWLHDGAPGAGLPAETPRRIADALEEGALE